MKFSFIHFRVSLTSPIYSFILLLLVVRKSCPLLFYRPFLLLFYSVWLISLGTWAIKTFDGFQAYFFHKCKSIDNTPFSASKDLDKWWLIYFYLDGKQFWLVWNDHRFQINLLEKIKIAWKKGMLCSRLSAHWDPQVGIDPKSMTVLYMFDSLMRVDFKSRAFGDRGWSNNKKSDIVKWRCSEVFLIVKIQLVHCGIWCCREMML